MDQRDFNKKTQHLLNLLGSDLKEDGIVGPKTEAALMYEISQHGDETTDKPVEPERPSPSIPGAKALWYPLADTSGPQMKARGSYEKGYPIGAVIHFTAGRDESEDDARGSLEWGLNEGYAFFVIGPTGKVYQRLPLNKWGYHAGTSSWPGLGSSLSDKLVGIEVACAGRLDSNRKSWFGKTYPESQCRTVSSKQNIQGGTYKKYTEAQERALIDLLMWLKQNNPSVFSLDFVLGHDSIAPSRKNDPGGSLSMTIPELQMLLKSRL